MIHKRILGFGSFLVKMLFLNCLCVLSILGVVSALIPEFILQSGASGHCGQTVSVNQSVILKSHTGAGLLGGLASYTASQNCEINYDAGTGVFSKSGKMSKKCESIKQTTLSTVIVDFRPYFSCILPSFLLYRGFSFIATLRYLLCAVFETSCMDSSWKNSRRVFFELSPLVKLRPWLVG